jgi:hypothetical protein
MPNAWIEHIRAFAQRNDITYSCAVGDPRCKEEYYKQKSRNSKKTRTADEETVGMGAEDVKAEAEAPKAKASTKSKSVIARFSNYLGGEWVLTEDNRVLILIPTMTTPSLLYKGSSTEDAYDWIKKNLSSREKPLGRHQHTFNLLSGNKSDHELLEKYKLKLGNPSTETRLLFYGEGDKRTIGDYITAMAGVSYTTKADLKANEKAIAKEQKAREKAQDKKEKEIDRMYKKAGVVRKTEEPKASKQVIDSSQYFDISPRELASLKEKYGKAYGFIRDRFNNTVVFYKDIDDIRVVEIKKSRAKYADESYDLRKDQEDIEETGSRQKHPEFKAYATLIRRRNRLTDAVIEKYGLDGLKKSKYKEEMIKLAKDTILPAEGK